MQQDDLLAEILRRAQNPFFWLEQAEFLKAAAITVFSKSTETFHEAIKEVEPFKRLELQSKPENWMFMPGVILWGFALENILKGLIISENINAVWLDKNKVVTSWGNKRGHDLNHLYKISTLPILTHTEEEHLAFLTKASLWGGRYPIPISLDELTMEWNQEKDHLTHQVYDRICMKYLERGITTSQTWLETYAGMASRHSHAKESTD